MKLKPKLLKNFSALKADYPPANVYFEDEMRVGTRTEIKRKWAPLGHRPKAPVKIGYEFVHLFVAIAPFTGKVFAMFLPALNQECFALFGAEFAGELTQKTFLVVDRATAHQQKLLNQDTIGLQKLPAACPELNPVERFFQELRRRLACKVFQSLAQAQEIVERELQFFFQNPKLVSSITNFPYLSITS